VPIDRAATVRNAEKLIRQGKLDAAIAEYVRIIEDQPHDWAAKNTLGDMYARAGHVDKAVHEFVEIADNLSDEGQMAKAGALYKKILKIKPDHEHALMQVADILGMQRLYADARAHLTTLMELRQGRGDTRGALQAKIRLGSLDPDDYEGRLMSVSARVEMGDKGGALSDLKEIASELSEKGRTDEAVQALREAASLHPGDEEVKEKLLDAYFATGDYARAREFATSLEQFRMIASAQETAGGADDAIETLRLAATHHADDTELRAALARKLIARGDVTSAAEYLTAETAGDDPELLMVVANIKLQGGGVEEGLAIVRRLLQDGSRRDLIAQLGWTIAEKQAEAGFKVVELAADSAVAEADWPAAAAALQEFVTRVPNHIPALMRLVEICVDGSLESTMYSTQAQLADAYIAAGSATEARFIAEDLVAREPWEKSNIERFRRALVLLGEPDPDAVIAARLSGESPFTSTDFLSGESLFDDPPVVDSPAPEIEAEPDIVMEDLLEAEPEVVEMSKKTSPPPAPAPKRPSRESHQFELSANAIDLGNILGDFDEPPPPPKAHAETEDVEVDLSIVIDDIKKPGAAPAGQPPRTPTEETVDLDGVFGNLRDHASRRSGLDDSEKEYKRGLALRASGDIDGCIQALEKASRAPRLRFATSWMIARLYRERDMMSEALEWLERAAQAPAPTNEESHQLLFELADGLEKTGEVARALAICLELQADAGEYKDVSTRIDRLTKVQAGG
jgi:tetratricopeptide (TPR) repeat protein